MLEGLDAIDWKTSSDKRHLNEKFPEVFRQMLSDDLPLRRNAQALIEAEITRDGYVYPVTLAAIPFLIELLESPATPDPEDVLHIVCQVARNCGHFPNDATTHIADERLLRCVDAYRLISAGYPVYARYLKHPSAEVRQSALKLLMELMDCNDKTRPALKLLLKGEKNPVVTATMLEALGRMVSGGPKSEAIHGYLKLIGGFLSPKHDRLVRVAAAGAWLNAAHAHFYRGPDYLPDEILPLLLEAIHNPIASSVYREFPLLPDDLMFISAYVLYARITWTGVDRSIEALNSPLLSTLQKHYLAREMLERVFERKTTVIPARHEPPYWRWKHFGGWVENNRKFDLSIQYERVAPNYTTNYYVYSQVYRKYQSAGRQIGWQRKVIQAIVECDAFWQISTNLFSYFYGLPDDRAELRELAGRMGE